MSNDHFVRHIVRSGDYVKTEYECRAEFGARCRLACDRCTRKQEEQCICESELERVPDMQDQGECLIVAWLKHDAPEEQFNGEDQPVRGPDWQPIVPEWNGDTWDWDYAGSPINLKFKMADSAEVSALMESAAREEQRIGGTLTQILAAVHLALANAGCGIIQIDSSQQTGT